MLLWTSTVSIVFAVSCRRTVPPEELTSPERLSDKVPRRVQQTIRSSSRVEAVLVNYYGPGTQAAGLDAGYNATSDAVQLNSEQARNLSALLLDRRSYQNEAYPCTFDPDVDYRFIGSADTIHAVICHGCDQLIYFRSGRPDGGAYVKRIALDLEGLSHSLFPKDSLITRLWQSGREQAKVAKR